MAFDGPQASPFLDDSVSPFLATDAPALDPAPSSSPPMGHHVDLDDALGALRSRFPGRSEFAITNMDTLLLLSQQLLESRLQGFDLAVLLFFMGHFQHKRPFVRLHTADIAATLDRSPAQIRRSIRKLMQLGWLLADSHGELMINTALLRSANPRYRAIGFRLANERFVSRP